MLTSLHEVSKQQYGAAMFHEKDGKKGKGLATLMTTQQKRMKLESNA